MRLLASSAELILLDVSQHRSHILKAHVDCSLRRRLRLQHHQKRPLLCHPLSGPNFSSKLLLVLRCAADCASNHFMHAANKEDALVQACQCTWALTVNSQVVADCLEILECLILQAGKKAPTARIAAGPDGSRGFAAGRGRGMPAAPPGIAPPPAPPGNPPSVPKTACRILVFAACFVSVAECRCMFT